MSDRERLCYARADVVGGDIITVLQDLGCGGVLDMQRREEMQASGWSVGWLLWKRGRRGAGLTCVSVFVCV